MTTPHLATKAELGNYLPSSGGTISGTLVVNGYIRSPELYVHNISAYDNQVNKVFVRQTIHVFKHLEVEGEGDIRGTLKVQGKLV